MNVIESLADIEKISLDILKDSKSLDVFPTPIDQILSYVNLNVDLNIDLFTIPREFEAKNPNVLHSALGKLRGVLDRKEKKVYIDHSQIETRRNFVKLHEIGHEVLPWQGKCCNILEDDDKTLDLDTQEEFESEANLFASATLFQQERFTSIINMIIRNMSH